MSVNILAHRGYCEIAPENTMLAFDAAKIFGFDGIELDIHMTKDKKLVVIHDEDIKRTTMGVGKIQSMTLKELREYNFTDRFGKEFPKQVIMTYDELLTKYGGEFKIINVEIKTDIIHYEGIEEKLWAIHQKIKPKAQILYSSFNLNSLVIMNKVSQGKALNGFLFVDERDCEGKEQDIKESCQYINPWFKSLLSKKSLDYYHKLGLPMNLWTFDRRDTGDEWTDGSHQALKKILKIDNIYSIISNSKY